MEQLIELLQQIQDLAGAGIDALKGASEGEKKPEGEPGAPEGEPAPPAEKHAPRPGGGGEHEMPEHEMPGHGGGGGGGRGGRGGPG